LAGWRVKLKPLSGWLVVLARLFFASRQSFDEPTLGFSAQGSSLDRSEEGRSKVEKKTNAKRQTLNAKRQSADRQA
jgi:hypothetical protein